MTVGTSARVSVVIPAFNAAEFLPQVLESVFRQTHPPLEVIVVDDGSTDGTPKVMQCYCDRVNYIRQENGGLSNARNRGIMCARADWIAFLDADDLCLPQRLEHQLALAERTQADLIFSDAVVVATSEALHHWSAPSWLAQTGSKEQLQKAVREEVLPNPFQHLMRIGSFILPSTVLVRRECLLDGGLFDESLQSTQDFELWCRLAAKHRFAFHSAPLVIRQVHGQNMTANQLETLRDSVKAWEKIEKLEIVRKRRVWRKLVQKKKSHRYWEQGYYFFERNQPAAARASWAKGLRISFSALMAAYWTVTLLPERWVIGLRSVVRRIKRWRASGAAKGGTRLLPKRDDE